MPTFAHERAIRLLEAITRAGGSAPVDSLANGANVDPADLDEFLGQLADSALISHSSDRTRVTISPDGRAFVCQADWPKPPTLGDG